MSKSLPPSDLDDQITEHNWTRLVCEDDLVSGWYECRRCKQAFGLKNDMPQDLANCRVTKHCAPENAVNPFRTKPSTQPNPHLYKNL